MKQLTKEELNTHLEALNIKFCEDKTKDYFQIYDEADECWRILLAGPIRLSPSMLGIKLKPEMPPITQENLCKFYLKFKDHDGIPWPEVIFSHGNQINDGSESGYLYAVIRDSNFMDGAGGFWKYCEMIDKRWPEIGE